MASPILDPTDQSQVKGSLIYFKDNNVIEAYERINHLEPEKHYKWMETKTNKNIKCNYLIGKYLEIGIEENSPLDSDYPWEGKEDPLFTDALDVIQETLEDNRNVVSFQAMFKLQMAYLLLWSAIERYAHFAITLGVKQ